MHKRLLLLVASVCAAAAIFTAGTAGSASAAWSLPFKLPLPQWLTSASPLKLDSWLSFLWPLPDQPNSGELAPADPDYEVVLNPEDEVKGVMLVIHGGGWIGSTDTVDVTRQLVGRFADWGWRTRIVGYRSGAAGLNDLERWYSRARDAVPAQKPVCAWGFSAGAHLALLLAEQRHLSCVIAESGPTYLPNTDEPWDLPGWVDGLARKAFGSRLREFSPLITNRDLKTPTLLAHAKADPLVPIGQAREYSRRIDNVEMVSLDPGDVPFIHTTGVDRTDIGRYRDAERALLREAVKRAGSSAARHRR